VVAVASRFTDDRKLSRAADQIAQILLTAKQRAKRDQIPTGVRLFPDPQHNGVVTQAVFIQQPDDFTGGQITLGPAPTNPLVPAATGYPPPTNPNAVLDFSGGYGGDPTLWSVQPGDYLSVKGQIHLITSVQPYNPGPPAIPSMLFLAYPNQPGALSGSNISVTNAYGLSVGMLVNFSGMMTPNSVKITQINNSTVPATVTVNNPGGESAPAGTTLIFMLPKSSWIAPNAGSLPGTTGYTIIRAPRVLTGETPLQLPEGICIDPTVSIPAWSSPASPQTLDIMFAPDGRVIQPGGTDRVILWARDYTKDAANPGDQFLILIQTHTGFIAEHPVNTAPGGNPYQFTQDARSSGM